MKEGVRKGMIQSKSACIAGRNAFKQRYGSIFNDGPQSKLSFSSIYLHEHSSGKPLCLPYVYFSFVNP